jgi:hypothetical protein
MGPHFLKSCGYKFSQRNTVELAGLQACPLQSIGRPSALETKIGRLEESIHQHWPTASEKRMNFVVGHACVKKRY